MKADHFPRKHSQQQGDPSQSGTPGPSKLESDTPSPAPFPKVQISLSLMLLMMVVFAFLSAALFYASRVPMIREELSVLFYGKGKGGAEDVGRLAHRAFIMFTFTSPLLLAGTLSLAVTALNRLRRRSA